MLEVRDLRVSYGAVQALAGISLEVREGEIVALIGANGAGKSSLIHAVAGLAPAAGGKVAFRGEEVLGMPSHRIFRRGIALCPEGRMVLGGLTVEENLKLAAPGRRSFTDLYELFPRLGERASSRGASLSGGEAQMLAIARALAQEPELLLLDEPSLGLAPNAVQAIFALLPELRDRGLTILLVEQNLVQALRAADRAYLLESGRIARQGPAEALLGDERIVERYLGLEEEA
ncbi:MAG: ABC transporter ATP-binding protein [Alphaproteobacteria bacterium]|nr:ABC transporter ATP-binding protein [Alphaproteobacteria bacterium]